MRYAGTRPSASSASPGILRKNYATLTCRPGLLRNKISSRCRPTKSTPPSDDCQLSLCPSRRCYSCAPAPTPPARAPICGHLSRHAPDRSRHHLHAALRHRRVRDRIVRAMRHLGFMEPTLACSHFPALARPTTAAACSTFLFGTRLTNVTRYCAILHRLAGQVAGEVDRTGRAARGSSIAWPSYHLRGRAACWAERRGHVLRRRPGREAATGAGARD